MTGFVAVNSDGIEFQKNATWYQLPELCALKQFDKTWLRWRFKPELAIKPTDELFNEGSHFADGRCRIGIDMLLREAAELSELGPPLPEKFEIQRLHCVHL
jgi:hypothetical protein